ncbi:hypothetical protein BJ508DRAFT_379373 [Ascobolus immersus RN42]|uniref:Saccharopine dehydrogenase NADP binding domain-containing protein n=1 Tax=Ascobolus immersus RN42 TaxID=1160509 RepID=A0A3N4I422_ASCIM|nr:hypothetical protein BJ508DRAFT_379373 [Ascobolus immersus RN42]
MSEISEKVHITPLAERPIDIILLGATGFTGQIIAKHLALNAPLSLKWSISGRSTTKLAALFSSLKAEPAAVNLPSLAPLDSTSLTTLVSTARVAICTIGPATLHAEPFLRACVEAGTAWLDLNGEMPWYAEMLRKYDSLARQTGAIIIPTCGFDSIPSDLTTLTLRLHAHSTSPTTPLTRVSTILESLKGSISNGSYSSILSIFDAFPNPLDFLHKPYILSSPTLTSEQTSSLHPQRTGISVQKITDPDLIFANKTRTQDSPQLDAKGGALASMGMIEGINRSVVLRTSALSTLHPTSLPQPEFDYREYLLTPPSRCPGKAKATAYATSFFVHRVIPRLMSTRFTRRLMQKGVNKFQPPGTGPSDSMQEEGYWRYRSVGETEGGKGRGVWMDWRRGCGGGGLYSWDA